MTLHVFFDLDFHELSVVYPRLHWQIQSVPFIFRQELGLISEAPYHQHGLGIIEYCCFIILLEPVKVGIVTEGCSVGDIPVARFRIIIDADIEFVPCLGGKIPI